MINYKIKNQSDDTAELIIYGIVGGYYDDVDSTEIIKSLQGITAKNILVRINSNGGSVFAGIAIYNALKQHPANVIVKIDSIAASIASIIAMSGFVEMPSNAFIMIHNPLGVAQGDADDINKMVEVLQKVKTSLISIYKAKTGLSESKLSEMMDDETWMDANEAVDKGFADKVISEQPLDLKNKILNDFRNVPEKLRSSLGRRLNIQNKNMSFTEKIMSNWKSDKYLRAEFNNDFASYAAYEGAVKKGLVSIIGN